MKPKYLYHGSGKRLKGEELTPRKANDLEDNADNSLRGVYASDYKNEALSMALHSCRGVREGSLHLQGIKGKIIMDSVVYEGWPKQKYIYLYILHSKTFEERPPRSHQWVSIESVKPTKIEKLLVKDYLYLIRRATEKEKKEFFEKYSNKINK